MQFVIYYIIGFLYTKHISASFSLQKSVTRFTQLDDLNPETLKYLDEMNLDSGLILSHRSVSSIESFPKMYYG